MKKIVIGISGASGMPLAYHLLKELKKHDVEIHLVISNSSLMTIPYECEHSVEDFYNLANVVYDYSNIGASIASGTFQVDGMIIIPCSMKTVAGLAHGYSDNLLLRAGDVMIKEKRKLILVTREAPLSPIHLDNLSYLSKLSNIYIIPPVLSYYNHPQTIEDMETHLIGKILSPFDIHVENFKTWQ